MLKGQTEKKGLKLAWLFSFLCYLSLVMEIN